VYRLFYSSFPHQTTGAFWAGSKKASPKVKKEIMMKQKILINHWRWLVANGYKQQAASCKQQAASLTRLNYRIIREYENKRST